MCLVTDNMGLVGYTIKKYHLPYDEDIFQMGCVGLMKAAKNFKSDLGYAFSTYAVLFIYGEMKNYMRDDTSIKISRKWRDLNNKIKSLQYSNNNLSLSEIAEELETTENEINECFKIFKEISCDSLDKIVYEDDHMNLSDKITIKPTEIQSDLKLDLKIAVNSLPILEREYFIHYHLYDYKQSQIAKIFNTSQCEVSRKLKSAADKLKILLGEAYAS